MATHHGKGGKLKLGANLVAEIQNWSTNETIGTADDTAMGDTDETHLLGVKAWTAKLSASYDPTDTNGQVALAVGASVTANFYTDGDATGKKYKTGTATVIDVTIDADRSDVVKFSASLKGNGALTNATAA